VRALEQDLIEKCGMTKSDARLVIDQTQREVRRALSMGWDAEEVFEELTKLPKERMYEILEDCERCD
jgi:hypothetical protein